MSVIPQTIVVEDRLKEMIADLPDMLSMSGSATYPVTFGYGDKKELNYFLANREATKPYPLIWFLYPYTEKHTRKSVEVENATFILAVPTNATMEVSQRLKETYDKVLFPLLDNFRWLIQKSNTINVTEEYDIVKFPNYSDTEAGEEHAGNFRWDAIQLKFSFNFNDKCYREVRFPVVESA